MSIKTLRVALNFVALLSLSAALPLAAPAVAQLTTTQQAQLVASNPKPVSGFGWSAASSGNTTVIGALSANTTLGGTSSGAAYVYLRNGASWTEQARLEASPSTNGDLVGSAVAISGDTIVVGAQFADTPAGAQSGRAFVFVRSGTTWTQQAVLMPADAAADDDFGTSVAISGDTIVVGAPQHEPVALSSGAAFVFVRSGTTWTQQAELKAPAGDFGDALGAAVAIEGDTVVAGAPLNHPGFVYHAGAAFVFVRSGTTWSQQAKLVDSDAGSDDALGSSVAISGNTVVAGAYDDSFSWQVLSGSASVFVRNGTSWSQQTKLIADDAEANDYFGMTVALSGDLLLVGAPDDNNDNGVDAGGLYVFARAGSTWGQKLKLIAPGAGENDLFGQSVAVSGDSLIAAAMLDDNAGGSDAGAAYALRLNGDWVDAGAGLAGTSGVPLLVGTGPLIGGTPGALTLSSARPSAACVMFISGAATRTPFKGGTLVPVPPLLIVPLATSPGGTLPLAFTWPKGGVSGLSLYFQFAIADPAAIAGVALSNAVRGKTP